MAIFYKELELLPTPTFVLVVKVTAIGILGSWIWESIHGLLIACLG